jgi:hypothetical protein
MSYEPSLAVPRGIYVNVDRVNVGPRVSLVDDVRNLLEAVALVRVAHAMPEDDGERRWDLGFFERFLRWKGEGGSCSKEERQHELHRRAVVRVVVVVVVGGVTRRVLW